jgi:hypothetical protein
VIYEEDSIIPDMFRSFGNTILAFIDVKQKINPVLIFKFEGSRFPKNIKTKRSYLMLQTLAKFTPKPPAPIDRKEDEGVGVEDANYKYLVAKNCYGSSFFAILANKAMLNIALLLADKPIRHIISPCY